ncbi:MAG TPA: hypothetical protein ENG63_09675 [Candidatus Desulfofervidus auxilii]|uniref:Uncharacterized protein n=1 Tax=Desulfofervidus auxilii TaxID=1621989 RepID=A0A7C0Y6T5_DESA2|nr:hypothetical protein [Candidatus Desulfofervidus auxilii]
MKNNHNKNLTLICNCGNKDFEFFIKKTGENPYSYEATYAFIAKCKKCKKETILKSWKEFDY